MHAPTPYRPSTLLLLALIVGCSALQLYRSPRGAGELEIIPDSVEYAVAARHLATTGRYAIDINGTAFPPRYPPGFSALFLAPIYRMAPGEIGNGVFAVTACAVMAAALAFVIGRRLAGDWGGVLAAVVLMHHKEFTIHCRLIMSDVPTVTLCFLACLIFLKMYADRTKEPTSLQFLAAGLIIAIAGSLRPLSSLIGLPFALMFVRDVLSRQPERASNFFLRGALLGAPILMLGVTMALYNQHTFGDWRRTGYQYWCPVPYDYPELVFSSIYLKKNLSLMTWKLVWITTALGCAGAAAIWKMRSSQSRAMMFYVFFGALPLCLVYLFYFFKELRFYYPAQALLCILGGAGLGALLHSVVGRFPRTSTALAALATLSILVPRFPAQPPIAFEPRRAVAEAIARAAPADAIVLTNMDPVYLSEFVVAGTHRTVWPVTRSMPYASRVIISHRVANPVPYPKDWEDQGMQRLLNAGGEPIFSFTANEAPDRVTEWIREGKAVYLECYPWKSEDPLDAAAKAALLGAMNGAPNDRYPWLIKLSLRNEHKP